MVRLIKKNFIQKDRLKILLFFHFTGKFIASSQRADGSWRKARRVKDGYVPQEEVPLYESKGKLIGKKSSLPVGMCTSVVKETKEKRPKKSTQNKKQTPAPSPKTPGLIVITETMADLIVSEDPLELAKKIKKLKKKIREIELIESKLNNGELFNPEKDQLDKVSRKEQILKEIEELEQ